MGLDPYCASIVKLANFFLFLQKTKLLSVSAIKAYLALTPVLHQSGIDLTTDKDLNAFALAPLLSWFSIVFLGYQPET